MFFIFGIAPKTIITKDGTFTCPVCQNQTGYQIQQHRNYFSLFFIKLFPVSKAKQPYLTCHSCRTVMPIDVLNHA